jgi:hypothetical protein
MSNVQTVAIAITFANDHVGIMRFVTHEYGPSGELRRRINATKGAVDAQIGRAVWPQPECPLPIKGWRIVDESDVPQDRLFRMAWFDEGAGKIAHDMVKVRDTHLERLRAERNDQLDALDRDWMRATGKGDKAEAEAIEAKRQALRDMPVTVAPALEAAQTVEDVKAIKLPE